MTEACLPACLLFEGVWDMCILCGEMIMTVHWTDQPVHDANYRSRKKIVAGEGAFGSDVWPLPIRSSATTGLP